MMQQVINFPTKRPDGENYNIIKYKPRDLSYNQGMLCLFCKHRTITEGLLTCEYLFNNKCSLNKYN